MNQQNQGPGSSNPSNAPAKRKRGRPRKEERTVQADTMPERRVPGIVINPPNQTASTTGSANDEMLGRVVTGVIDGRFGGGYLLHVQIGDSPTYLRGLVFKPGEYVPVTPENDVAPHLEMIRRIDFPIPVLNPQAQMQSSIPSSGQGSGQPVELQLQVPTQVLPIEIHSGASISLNNPSASVLVPMTNIPTTDSSIPAGAIPQTLSDPGQGSQSVSTMKMDCGKILEQDASKLDKSTQVKEPKSTAEDTNLLPLTGNIDRELQTGQHSGSSVQLNEQIQDLPKISNVELNQMPAPAGPETIQSEQIQGESRNSNIEVSQMLVSTVPEPVQTEQIQGAPMNSNIEVSQMLVSTVPEPVQSEPIHEPRNTNMELNEMPASAEPEATQSEQIHEPRNTNMELNEMPVSADPEAMQSEQIHEPRNTNMELNEMPVTAEPEAMQSEQIHEPRNSNMELNEMPVSADPENVQSVDKLEDKPDSPKPAHGGDVGPSESRFGSEGSDLPEMSDPLNHGPSGETTKEDDIQPSGETTKSVEPENPIGPDIF